MKARPRNDVGRNRNINFPPNIRLWRSAKTGNTEQAKLALREGADPSFVFGFGHTSLHRAAEFNSEGVAEVLVLAGADVMAVNCPGRGLGVTPMAIAKAKGHVHTVQIMVKAAEIAVMNLERFQQGDRVCATRKGQLAVLPGIITRTRRNGTYDIAFEDGINASSVPRQNVRAMEESLDRTAFGVQR